MLKCSLWVTIHLVNVAAQSLKMKNILPPNVFIESIMIKPIQSSTFVAVLTIHYC
ncbi:hypothetical protein BLA29_013338 [Euroglyphus maynei]|uniref:Uncharacterized protein n=1 Tax=Euroglyphus maynei TaxID=6958 RepID=A0A1Y3B717_EURMA|nr:hypothetical protein BLA29_013338 [Euroglyphus maynei]